MAKELTRYKLGDLIEVKRGQSLAGEYYAEEGEYIRLTLANFDYQNGGFKEDKQKADLFYTGPVRKECVLNEGDIITPLTEQALGLLGSTARIPKSGIYVQSGDVALIKCNEELIDPSFCYYLLPSAQVKKQLAAGSQQTKIRHTSPDAIKACIVDIPCLEDQKKIGGIMDAITSKISLNRSINKELEEMAKEIYDYWFVQFDFPDANGRPYKSSGGKMVYNPILKREIPEGWEVGNLEHYVTSISERTSKIDNDYANYTPIEVIPRKKISFFETAPIEKAVSGLCKYKTKDILLSNRRVYFHKVSIVPFNGVTRDTVIILRPNFKGGLGYSYQLVNSDHFIEFATKHSYGSEQPVLSWETAKRYKVCIPPKEIVLSYNNKMLSSLNVILNNEIASGRLTKLRDELLPLLMNGQVKLKE